MHYTFDILNCLLFAVTLFILWSQKWQISKRHRAVYGLTIIVFVYLVGAVYFALSWHSRTGLNTIEPFFAFDTLYFVALNLVLGFLMLYFADICMGKVKHPFWLFIIPLSLAAAYLFINPSTGLMFGYVDGEYQRGPLHVLNYIVWFCYFIAMIVLAVQARGRLGIRTLSGLLLFIAYEIALQIYQFFIIDFYIGGIAFTTGLLYLVIAPLFLEPRRNELTGLYNREGFFNVVEELLHYDTENEYYLIAVDINNFRNVNERFGFQAGNQVLSYMGKYFNELYPDVESIGCFNADHFFICCPRDKAILDYPSIPLSECLPEELEPYTVSLYAGIYPIQNHNEDISLMCDRARFALQQIKGDYHKKYAFFDAHAQERLRFKNYILREMKSAINESKFVVHFQPVIDVEKGTISGAESLLRWKDNKYGTIAPQDFIPYYEENGSVSELDLYVCAQACRQVALWKEAGYQLVPVSVNVSRVSLLTSGFIDSFAQVVSQAGISPREIRIEVTESAFVQTNKVREQLTILHDKGFKILMDDFGTGYSSFNTFAYMPVDILKVDMGFVNNFDSSERGQAVFSSIVEMAEKLSMPIVAEGVETKEQAYNLRSLGIRYMQGYYFSRPMPAQDYEAMMLQTFQLD